VKRRTNTFQTALVPPLDKLGFPSIPEDKDKAKELLEELWAVGSAWQGGIRTVVWWGYNPEKFLKTWAGRLSCQEFLSSDVIGWALFATQREVEYYWEAKLTAYDFLTRNKPFFLLSQLRLWAEARLRYYRVGLQLTFYARDKLAGEEPIASNVGLLRERLKHFVAVRVREIREAAKDKGYPLGSSLSYTSSKLDYVCWLHLVSPISEQWTLHEIGKAVKKMFFPEYAERVKKFWEKPPEKLTYRESQVGENDSPGKRYTKLAIPVELEAEKDDWLSSAIFNLRPFNDSLADWLAKTDFAYKAPRGRPSKSSSEIPTESPEEQQRIDDLLKILRSTSALENVEGLGKKDLEKDEPKGWLLAKTITA
jgi:hypothetical protein